MGPLLFCLTINPVLTNCKAEFRVGYLDDITLGGEQTALTEEVSFLRDRAGDLGLILNDSKCELLSYSLTLTTIQGFENSTHVSIEKAVLLGSPLYRPISYTAYLDKSGFRQSHGCTTSKSQNRAARLPNLHSHDAFNQSIKSIKIGRFI